MTGELPEAGTPVSPASRAMVRYLRLAAVTLVAAALLLVLPVGSPLAVVPGLALALVLPGLALRDALGLQPSLTPVERALLVPVLSLAVVVLTGLVLQVVGVGLGRGSWAVALTVVTAAGLTAAALSPARGTAGGASPTVPRRGRERLRDLLGVGRHQREAASFAVAALALAAGLSVWSAQEHETGVTALTAVPIGGERRGSGPEVFVTFRNGEEQEVPYRLLVRRGDLVVVDEVVRLGAGESVQRRVPREDDQVRVEVFRQGSDVPLREVVIEEESL